MLIEYVISFFPVSHDQLQYHRWRYNDQSTPLLYINAVRNFRKTGVPKRRRRFAVHAFCHPATFSVQKCSEAFENLVSLPRVYCDNLVIHHHQAWNNVDVSNNEMLFRN
jgi:site-specific DNA-cytosine methylase